MVEYVDIRVKGSLGNVRDQIGQAFAHTQTSFKVKWETDMNGKAEHEVSDWKPRVVRDYRCSIDFEVSGSDEAWNLRLFKTYVKQIPNPLGIHNSVIKWGDKQFEQVVDFLASRFSSQGLLTEV